MFLSIFISVGLCGSTSFQNELGNHITVHRVVENVNNWGSIWGSLTAPFVSLLCQLLKGK